MTEFRVGHGFDVHAFSDDPDRPLILGGVAFEGPGLVGHSDADPVAHACIDALLGAAGLGDVGAMFPDSDAAWADADSIDLLIRAVAALRGEGWQPGNVDCTVVCEQPRLAPRRHEMQRRLSDAVGAPVTVKGKRAEGLGALGVRTAARPVEEFLTLYHATDDDPQLVAGLGKAAHALTALRGQAAVEIPDRDFGPVHSRSRSRGGACGDRSAQCARGGNRHRCDRGNRRGRA